MVLIVDGIILALLIISALMGRKIGVVRMVLACVTVALALVLSGMFGSELGNAINNTSFVVNIKQDYVTRLEARNEKEKGEKDALSEESSILDVFKIDLNKDEKDNKKEELPPSSENKKIKSISFERIFVNSVAAAVTNAIGSVLVFAVSLVALNIIGHFINKLFEIKPLDILNKILGLVTGTLMGVFGVFILCTVLRIVLLYNSPIGFMYNGMENDTYLYGFFCKINPIDAVLFG